MTIYALLGIYIVYGIGALGLIGLLFSAAVGLIFHGLHFELEFVLAATILSGVLWKGVLGRYLRVDGFLNRVGDSTMTTYGQAEGFRSRSQGSGVPLFQAGSQQGIVGRIQSVQRKAEPSGILSSQFAEGFADANTTDAPTPDAGSEKATPEGEKKPATGSSSAAPTDAAASTPQLLKDLPSPTKAAESREAAEKKPEEKKSETSGFADKLTDGMFKLGAVPPDAVGGSHIDIGTTLMTALNSLKPDQIKAMTTDTQKLMETQKSLMTMLTTMKPMLQDGKQMMDTFQNMFGNGK